MTLDGVMLTGFVEDLGLPTDLSSVNHRHMLKARRRDDGSIRYRDCDCRHALTWSPQIPADRETVSHDAHLRSRPKYRRWPTCSGSHVDPRQRTRRRLVVPSLSIEIRNPPAGMYIPDRQPSLPNRRALDRHGSAISHFGHLNLLRRVDITDGWPRGPAPPATNESWRIWPR